MQVGLSAYRFQMKERYGREWWSFLRGSATDAYEELNGYFKNRRGRLVRLGVPDVDGNYADQRAILLAKVVVNEGARMLAGLILKGEAGAVREIRNFDDPEADASYRTSVKEGILSPLYFRLHVEDDRNFGVLLLQTFGPDGMKGFIETDLRSYFSQNDVQQRSIKLTQLVDERVLQAFAENGQLQDVIVINKGKSPGSRRAMEQNNVGGVKLGAPGDKLIFRVQRRDGWTQRAIQSIQRIVRHRDEPRGLIQGPLGSHIDDLKVELKIDGRTQTFSLVNPDDSPLRYSINVRFGPDGHPTWASIHEAAEETWAGLQQLIDGQ